MTRRRRGFAAALGAVVIGCLTLLGPAPVEANKAERGAEVVVDPRVELMSILFRLAGNREYRQGRVASYVNDVEEHFGPHRGHAAVKTADRLRRTYGVSYDAVMSMAVHLTDADTLGEAVPFEPHPEDLDERWKTHEARLFLDQARDFAEKSDFAGFLKEHEKLYATAVERFEAVLKEHGRLEWFDEFFGKRAGAEFTVALGMLNGPANYGARLKRGRSDETLYCVLGVWATDGEGKPSFDKRVLGTVAHEFCHSYVNPLVDKHRRKLKKSGETLFPLVAEAMRRQAYSGWETLMKESLVRACVVRYVRATEGEAAAEEEARRQVERKFLWTPQLAALLGEYEANRKRYRTLDAFLPRIAELFDDYAPELAKEMENRAKHEPKVVSMTPVNGSRDVDPKLTKIVVTFDREMSPGGFAFVGGGPKFPETTGRASYDRTRRVITLPVKLKPNWTYEFWLNRGRFDSFRSKEGVSLKSVHVTFTTGPGR
jgi:hypothetical protein